MKMREIVKHVSKRTGGKSRAKIGDKRQDVSAICDLIAHPRLGPGALAALLQNGLRRRAAKR